MSRVPRIELPPPNSWNTHASKILALKFKPLGKLNYWPSTKMQPLQNEGSLSWYLWGEHWTPKSGELFSGVGSALQLCELWEGSGCFAHVWAGYLRAGACPSLLLPCRLCGVEAHRWRSQQPSFQVFLRVRFLRVRMRYARWSACVKCVVSYQQWPRD